MHITPSMKKWTVLPAIGAAALIGTGVLTAEQSQADTTTVATPAKAGSLVTVRVPRGGKVTLPWEGVTRVIAANDDVARGGFNNGKAEIEGVTTGTTRIEIFQGFQSQILEVQVHEKDAINPAAPVVMAAVPAGAGVGTMDSTATAIAAAPNEAAITPSVAPRSSLSTSLRVTPASDKPSQALYTITYNNSGVTDAQNVVVRYALDDQVSYVTGSGTNGARYDAAARELVWELGAVPAGSTGQTLSFRLEPTSSATTTVYSVATIEDATGVLVSSNRLRYAFTKTPLLTVFALPDRILARRNGLILVDVRNPNTQQVLDDLASLDVVKGPGDGKFYPDRKTQRAQYATMVLRGLNLRDMRGSTAIKYVLARPSRVNLKVYNSANKVVATLADNKALGAGEHYEVWDGMSGTGYVAPGRYTYVCNARDDRGESTELRGQITVVAQTPLQPSGTPSFIDVKPSAWYASYLAVAEKQSLIKGYGDRTFRPEQSISRLEATAIMIRAMGLEDLARRARDKDAGFLDYQNIPSWGGGYVYVASAIAKTQSGRTMIEGTPSNMFEPNRALRREDAARIVQRLIDRDTKRVVSISGQMEPGTTVTIGSRRIQAADDGSFSFELEQSPEPVTMTFLDLRG